MKRMKREREREEILLLSHFLLFYYLDCHGKEKKGGRRMTHSQIKSIKRKCFGNDDGPK
jgi:hypothetical protein